VGGPQVRVLAETPELLIAEKRAGQVVEPEPGQISLVELLASQRPGFDVGGRAFPGVAHRLDKQTSGALAFARTDEALAALRLAFDEGRVDKRYRVIVLGAPPHEGRFDTPYARNPENTRLYTTRIPSPRRASLAWRAVEQFNGAALLEITLETGRTHQVRCQFAEAGFPVLGDALYGGREAREHPAAHVLGRHALHAARLSVTLPSGVVSAESPLPEDFLSALGTLRGKA
jgi:23S rRNA pseudouridine1911/1915/1917 synthase